MINRIFTYWLKDKDLHRIGLKYTANKLLKEKDIDVFENLFDFKKSVKNLADIDDRIIMTVENYEPKTKTEMEDKKRVVSILNKIRYSKLDFYLDLDTIADLHKNINMIK